MHQLVFLLQCAVALLAPRCRSEDFFPDNWTSYLPHDLIARPAPELPVWLSTDCFEGDIVGVETQMSSDQRNNGLNDVTKDSTKRWPGRRDPGAIETKY